MSFSSRSWEARSIIDEELLPVGGLGVWGWESKQLCLCSSVTKSKVSKNLVQCAEWLEGTAVITGKGRRIIRCPVQEVTPEKFMLFTTALRVAKADPGFFLENRKMRFCLMRLKS